MLKYYRAANADHYNYADESLKLIALPYSSSKRLDD